MWSGGKITKHGEGGAEIGNGTVQVSNPSKRLRIIRLLGDHMFCKLSRGNSRVENLIVSMTAVNCSAEIALRIAVEKACGRH